MYYYEVTQRGRLSRPTVEAYLDEILVRVLMIVGRDIDAHEPHYSHVEVTRVRHHEPLNGTEAV